MLGFTVFGFNYTKVTGFTHSKFTTKEKYSIYTQHTFMGYVVFRCYALNAITTFSQSLEIEAELLLHVISRSVEVFIFIT